MRRLRLFRTGSYRCPTVEFDMISADEVIRRVELYFGGGAIDYLSEEQRAASEAAILRA